MEIDDFNRNPCMNTFLKLIDVMQEKFGGTYKPGEMPKWMAEMENKFSTPGFPTDCVNVNNCIGVHTNVKLFILKIIMNRPKVDCCYFFVPTIEGF